MNEPVDAFELSVLVSNEAETAFELLKSACELSETRLQQAIESGAVWHRRGKRNRRLQQSNRKLKVGDELSLFYNARILDEKVESPRLLSDEHDYSIWIKPRGVHSQGTRYGDHCAMCRLAEHMLRSNTELASNRTAYLVHRLDRYANGLMLLAHTKKAATSLSSMFQQRSITKRYTALAHGRIAAEPDNFLIESEIDGRRAKTHILSAKPGNTCTLVDLQIETGRKHQVRRHLSEIGHPIVGDRQYVSQEHRDSAFNHMDLQLSASYLEFNCPISGDQKCYTLPDSYLLEMNQALSV